MYPNSESDEVHEEKITTFDKAVKRSGSSVTFLAQFLGFCPFSLDSKNRFRLKLTSVPFFMFIIQTLTGLGWWLYFVSKGTGTKEIFGTNQTGTDTLSHVISGLFTVFSQLANRILTLLHASDIISFTGKLFTVYDEVYESDSEASKIRFEQKLKRNAWKMNLIVAIICPIAILNMYGYLYYLRVNTNAFVALPPNETPFFVVSFLTSNLNSLLMISKALLYVHSLDLISIGFSELNYKAPSKVFLKQYASLKGLVCNFNSMFSLELTITTLAIGVFFVNSLYTGCVDVKYQVGRNLLMPIEEVTVHGMAIFLLCSSATQITRQVTLRLCYILETP